VDSSTFWEGDDTEFRNNNASRGSGGAIFAANSSTVSWDGPANFTGNVALDGGAVALVDFGYEEAHFMDALFIENSCSGNGGAFYVYNCVEGFNFTNVRFDSNSASGAGGAFAMYAGTDHKPATFTACSFSENTAGGNG
ncbi:unnamed protein product, partial [Scytosiphon promiscuus]